MKPPTRPRILVVDDHLEMARTLCDALEDNGFSAVALASGKQAIDILGKEDFDAVVTDLRMPDANGLDVMEAAKRIAPECPVLIMTAFGAVDSAIESIRKGAYHYFTKPFKTEELLLFLERALEEQRIRKEATVLKSALRERFSKKHIVGNSHPIAVLTDVIERIAASSNPVLILGETGTGKSLVARALHAEGPRADHPFVTINCAAVPDALLESELFGHVKGAFTGAVASRPGMFAEASGGTLFLDEIGEMSVLLQAKLLGAIERSAVRPVGSEKELPVDVRIVAATNRDLHAAVRTGTFRQDLLYRLNVVPIEVPPLRHRRVDILPLVERFLNQARARNPQSPVQRISRQAADALVAYNWPGNVRELEHVIERLVLLGRSAEIGHADLPDAIAAHPGATKSTFQGSVLPIRELQRRYAAWALEQFNGHKSKTAAALDIDDKTLAKWLSERPEGK